jgi:transcriptional regulator with XRE-family HTH domain
MSPRVIDPRDALDQTLRVFELKASDLAERSGIDAQQISKYRNKRKDMNSLNLYKLIEAMPIEAQFYFQSIVLRVDGVNTPKQQCPEPLPHLD